MKTTHCYTQTTPFNLGPIGPINVQILFYLIITNFFKNFHNVIEIMLWKFLWTYQKNHAIENHTMENHVRRGLTVLTCRKLQINQFWTVFESNGYKFINRRVIHFPDFQGSQVFELNNFFRHSFYMPRIMKGTIDA